MVHLQLTDAEGRVRRLPAQPAFEKDLIRAVTDNLPWYLRWLVRRAVRTALRAVIKDAHDLVRPRLNDER